MLILTRKKDEGLIIDDRIRIYVVGIEDGKVKLGIDAPKDVTILRNEVYERIGESNREALKSTGGLEALARRIHKEKE